MPFWQSYAGLRRYWDTRGGVVRAPLREREFRLLFAGRTVSLVGTAIAPGRARLRRPRPDRLEDRSRPDPRRREIPLVVFLLVGGIWADRLPRNLVMVGANVVSGVAQASTAALLITGNAEIWQLAALAAVNGGASAFFFPASPGVVPQTVPAALLQQANALLRLAMNTAMIGGAALGGLPRRGVGPGWALAVDAATYLLAAGCSR